MTTKGYVNDFYKQFEELNKKLDKLLIENKMQSLTISNLNSEIESLENIIKNKDEIIEKLLEERDKYKNHSDKNSSNSGKPSSSDMTKPKKTGANLYNSRNKTNSKVGGQKGHQGHNLSKENIETLKEKNDIKEIVINHTIKGNSNNSPIVKYKLGLAFVPYIEKHVFNYSEDSNEVLPKDFYTDVTYTNNLKSLIVFMNVHNVLSISRLTEFFRVVSNGIINLSQGTVCPNFQRKVPLQLII